ncbi:hypothetical protein GCM10023229_14490 [Flavisolibacter ginsenosidimutans]
MNFTQSGAGQYDAISPQTHLGRTTVLNNLICQNVSGQQPCNFNVCNTQWAYGSIANWNTLSYNTLYTTNGCDPTAMIGRPMVLHLLAENVYLQVTFNSWTAGSPGFSYNRTTGSLLPVLLSKFSGRRSGNAGALAWTTETEINCNYFTVQRSSNGTDYQTIGTVMTKAAGGNSSTPLDYDYLDPHPLSGNNYYRLEQLDRDGKKEYSPVVKLAFGSTESSYRIVQNPVAGRIDLVIFSSISKTVTIKIVSMEGRVVKTLIKQITSGDNNLQVGLENLPNGLYVLQVCEEGKHAFTDKVVKQ